MTTAYPAGLDNFTNPTGTDNLDSVTVPHATQHANANDAIEAIEAELGINPSGSSTTVADRFDTDEANFTALKKLPINTQTASYTLVLADAEKVVEMNVATANNLTVPPNSSVAFPLSTSIPLTQLGAGQTTVVAGSGVTIRSSGGKLKLTGQYSGAFLYKRGTDEWVLQGDISA